MLASLLFRIVLVIYDGVLYLITPLILLYLKKRGRKNPDYLKNWHERFGFSLVNPNPNKGVIWLHSVSVGETRAMQMLVKLIKEQYSNKQILITTMTPTGRATAKSLYPDAIVHYIPYDLPHAVDAFYKTFNPDFGIIMETEVWPNLIRSAKKHHIPLYLANARLSNKSYNGYRKAKILILPILKHLSAIFTQDANTKSNFIKLGFTGKIINMGNTKFDLVHPATFDKNLTNLQKIFKTTKKIVTFASSRDGEEKLFIQQIKNHPIENVVYLIIPRHPERFSEVEDLLIQHELKYQRRSHNQVIDDTTQVVLGDSMGEMLEYYTLSYIVLMGGSFLNCGGQNPIEVFYMNKPVIFGPSMFNFADVATNSLVYKCALNVETLNDGFIKLQEVLANDSLYQTLTANCSRFISVYTGASARILAAIADDAN